MHKALQTSHGLEVVVLDRLIVLARGTDVFTLPVSSLGNLQLLLESVRQITHQDETSDAFLSPSGSVHAPRTSPPTARYDQDLIGEQRSLATASPTRHRRIKPTVRRGRIWEAVKQTLHDQRTPIEYQELLTLVSTRALTAKNANHALRICLGKKLSSGELLQTPQGQYYLAPHATATSAPTDSRRPGRNRPGKLWQGIREFLGRHPDGLSQQELVLAAAERGWTNATHVEHAVRICLARVSTQLDVLPGGKYVLRTTSQPTAVKPSVVRRRRQTVANGNQAQRTSSTPVPDSPETTRTQPDTSDFVASAFYPRRSNRG